MSLLRPTNAYNSRTLTDKLGIIGDVRHFYDPIILPVVIVDSEVSLTSITTPQTLGIPSSAGEVSGPAANTRLANTGAQAAGAYNVTLMYAAGEGNYMRLRRRNAADAADVWSQRSYVQGGYQPIIQVLRVTLAANEFLVIENVNGGTAGVVYQASIWLQGPF